MLELNYKEFGSGDPIVILHGLFGTLDNWQGIAKQLAEKYLVYIVDQRNHGKSPHTEEFSYQLLAEDLHHFLREKGIFRSHILGHSMGGKTAMQFASEHPEEVDKLIVVDIGPFQYPGGHQTIFEALFSVDLDHLNSRKDALASLSSRIEDPSVIQFLLKNLSRKPEGGFRWKMNLKSLFNNYQGILEALPEEELFFDDTLFIRGERSDYLPEDGEEQLRNWFPEAKLQTIHNAGHWVHAEAPGPFLEEVKKFLSN